MHACGDFKPKPDDLLVTEKHISVRMLKSWVGVNIFLCSLQGSQLACRASSCIWNPLQRYITHITETVHVMVQVCSVSGDQLKLRTTIL